MRKFFKNPTEGEKKAKKNFTCKQITSGSFWMISCTIRYLRASQVNASSGQHTKLSLCWPNAWNGERQIKKQKHKIFCWLFTINSNLSIGSNITYIVPKYSNEIAEHVLAMILVSYRLKIVTMQKAKSKLISKHKQTKMAELWTNNTYFPIVNSSSNNANRQLNRWPANHLVVYKTNVSIAHVDYRHASIYSDWPSWRLF